MVTYTGAGAAGSSAAYHLHKFANISGVAINITVFERSDYVGGRSTTVDAYNDSKTPVELGASIFVQVNTILKNATDEFNLSARNHVSVGDELEVLGIWNGDKFVYTQKEGGWAWWDITKLIWKYGMAPIRTQNLMKATVGKFLKLYEAPFFPFRSLSGRAFDLDLTAVTAMTGDQYLASNNVCLRQLRVQRAIHCVIPSLTFHYRSKVHSLQTLSRRVPESTMAKIWASYMASRQWFAWP